MHYDNNPEETIEIKSEWEETVFQDLLDNLEQNSGGSIVITQAIHNVEAYSDSDGNPPGGTIYDAREIINEIDDDSDIDVSQ